MKTPEDLAALPVLDPDENPVFQREIEIAKGVCEHYRGEVPVLATIFTPLTWMQEMMHSCNPAPAMQMMAEHPKEVHRALEALLETNKKAVGPYDRGRCGRNFPLNTVGEQGACHRRTDRGIPAGRMIKSY